METVDLAHLELKKVLTRHFMKIKAKNSSYSLRAFSKSIDVHPAALSEFFNDKRTFGKKIVQKILKKLPLTPEEREKLLSQSEKISDPKSIERLKIDTANYDLVANPLYYSILGLLDTRDSNLDLKKISQRLEVRESEVKKAILRLIDLDYITGDEGGPWVKKDQILNTTDDIMNDSLRARHLNNLEKAQEALLNLDVLDRYFTFETLAVGPKSFPAIKRLINEFQDRLNYIAKLEEATEVYEFCFQFFPRTKLSKEDV